MKKSVILSLLGLALCLCVISAGHAAAPEGFQESPIPERWGPEWRAMNDAESAFSVALTGGRLEIGKVVGSRGDSKFAVPGGVLIGENKGEWGGRLVFWPDGDPKKEVFILEGNVTAIFLFQGKIHVLEGLAHLGLNDGTLYRLEPHEGSFLPTRLFRFDSAPYVAASYGDTLLILAHDAFFTVQNGEKRVIFSKTFWGGLYPNSLAVVDLENIYCGLRGGIVKLDIHNKRIELYTPAR